MQLYVYDLSNGMARAMSQGFLGVQIDAVYHTAIVMDGIEYFYGAGVQTAYAGKTHHGRPMETVDLGQTSLDMPTILEYLESLRQIYTAESYDLFAHNCNNFSNDFAMFLVGKNIPAHITSLPETVLKTPFGQMLKPQIDQAMRGVTQAPVPAQNVPQAVSRPSAGASLSTGGRALPQPNGQKASAGSGIVHNVSTAQKLDQLLDQAKTSCACIFFTSATCPPCKIVYPTYDELAEEFASQATLIKVDISQAYDIASRYTVRATPTFMTFLKGRKEHEWSGANAAQLKGNVRMLVQSAFPPHPHEKLSLKTFLRQSTRPIVYSKLPPLEKLTAKLGAAASKPGYQKAVSFIQTRNAEGAREAPLPDLLEIGQTFRDALHELPQEVTFIAYDLLRLMLVDPRASGFFAEEADRRTMLTLLRHVNSLETRCPYNLRIVAIHVGCNLFSSPVFRHSIATDEAVAGELVSLVLSSLQDKDRSQIRVAATSLAMNLATSQYLARQEQRSVMTPGIAYDLAACLCHGIDCEEESKEVVRGLVLALGRIVYKAADSAQDSELLDLISAMDAKSMILKKHDMSGMTIEDKGLLVDVGRELLGSTVTSSS